MESNITNDDKGWTIVTKPIVDKKPKVVTQKPKKNFVKKEVTKNVAIKPKLQRTFADNTWQHKYLMGEYYDSSGIVLYEDTFIEKYCNNYQKNSDNIKEQNNIVESILPNLKNIKWNDMYYTGQVFDKNCKVHYELNEKTKEQAAKYKQDLEKNKELVLEKLKIKEHCWNITLSSSENVKPYNVNDFPEL